MTDVQKKMALQKKESNHKLQDCCTDMGEFCGAEGTAKYLLKRECCAAIVDCKNA